MKRNTSTKTRVVFGLAWLMALLLCGPVFGQTTLGIGTSGLINKPSKAKMNAKITSSCYVVNTGDTAFSGQLELYMATDKNSTPVQLDKKSINKNNPLNPGDSILMSAKFDVLNSSFSQGSNIVVVWPTGTVVKGIDTFKTTLIIEGETSVDTTGNNTDTTTDTTSTGISKQNFAFGGVSVYPNPARGQVHIKAPANLAFSQMSVTDLSGKVIRLLRREEALNALTNGLDLHDLPAGMYCLSMTLTDGNRHSFRISLSGQ